MSRSNLLRLATVLALGPLLFSCARIQHPPLERIVVAPDHRSFVLEQSGKPFVPWGVNYGNHGRLMEDFWGNDWTTIVEDFREIKAMGGNVVRVHLQFGKFMRAADQPDRSALKQLGHLLSLAEQTGMYVDVTGLACYRTNDTPAWYDALDDEQRWKAQASFWRAVAGECAGNPAVFCYDLMNEPVAPSKATKWYSGNLFGGYDFVQNIAKNPGDRDRGELAIDWIRTMTAAIREKDRRSLITVGLLPWVTGWKHLSGIVPRDVAPHLDFISVHIYPKTKQPEEAPFALRECAAGKPVVIEETFALECHVLELEKFLQQSREIARGWIWHYDGITVAEYDQLERNGKLGIAESVWRDNLRAFTRLRPEFARRAENGTGR